MVFQIEFSDITEKAVLAVILIAWCFAGMRILYGYWPWQSGSKKRNALSGEIVSHESLAVCEAKRGKIIEMRMEKLRILAGASRAVALQDRRALTDPFSHPKNYNE